MGADIHMYVEYTNKERLGQQRKERANGNADAHEYWQAFGGNINPGRNYDLFSILSAGVRGNHPDAFKAKGLPNFGDLGYCAQYDAYMFITDQDGDNCVKLDTAMRYANGYKCKIINDKNGIPKWVQDPDWHGYSWLTPDEFEKALQLYNNLENNWDEIKEYEALLAAMKVLESDGKNEVRVVFWFDN